MFFKGETRDERDFFVRENIFLGGITATDQVKKIYIADPYISYFDLKCENELWGCLLLKRKNELEMSFFAYYYLMGIFDMLYFMLEIIPSDGGILLQKMSGKKT